MVAQRRGLCAVCGLRVDAGERIAYERAVGARHLACDDRDAARRLNLHRARCEHCRTWLAVGKGELTCVESEPQPGVFVRRWLVTCRDTQACAARG